MLGLLRLTISPIDDVDTFLEERVFHVSYRDYIQSVKMFGAAIALVLVTVHLTFADDTHVSNKARPNKGSYEDRSRSINPDEIDYRLYNRSGTAGRMGLGASPLHPEGPGNVTN